MPEVATRFSTKDCRSCNRRRIHCDREIPSCVKCLHKGIQCPGYEPRLVWIGDTIRSRRRPSKRVELSQSNENLECTDSLTSQSLTCNAVIEAASCALLENSKGKLLSHYNSVVAPMLVWLDHKQNEYKVLVMPLAENHQILRLALLTIAAEHLSEPTIPSASSLSAGEAVLRMVAEQIRRITSNQDATMAEWPDEDIKALLAAILTLSNHSLLRANLSDAQFHRSGARILLNCLNLKDARSDELTIFLQNQLSAFDILACTTLFDHHHVQQAILPRTESGSVIFGEFLKHVHRVTTESLVESRVSKFNLEYMLNVEDSFELARGATLLAVGATDQNFDSVLQRDFIRLTQVYHHAGVLYACQRLRPTGVCDLAKEHARRLLRMLQAFENLAASLHNLAWPIFIAGLCTSETTIPNATVINLCETLCRETRFEHYSKFLEFFHELWGNPHLSWVSIAQRWEAQGVPIIAV